MECHVDGPRGWGVPRGRGVTRGRGVPRGVPRVRATCTLCSVSQVPTSCEGSDGADAVTVNGYMGRSAVEPFVESGLGVYVLVRTSNPDSDELQTEPLVSGGTVAQRMASVVHDLGRSSRGQQGLSDVGAVVGATKRADEVEELRGLMPDAPVLVPGVGAQGGTIEQVRPLVRAGSRIYMRRVMREGS